ncbi:hypothetical protein L211DRAFT_836400 [Terfezia boudieri ATCC MYA-4762]|uniref:Uncharacterized protein n=1 Tax=Terfezia boudieri ATCC MYA-4762 TaxID=1051890 RepID=A0A3N4LVE7_9PEZI|nr:hypothetical protein L211DRAFT_836400 [Terfezia boudieri ATCC MYA-4762]
MRSGKQSEHRYAEQNPKTAWPHIQTLVRSENPKKELTQSQISKILIQNIDPAQITKALP